MKAPRRHGSGSRTWPHRARRGAAAALVWCVAAGGSAVTFAGAHAAQAPSASAANPPALPSAATPAGATEVRDRIVRPGKRALRATAAASSVARYEGPGGHTVRVRVSDAYPDPKRRARELVDFLATLVHGEEMGTLTAFIATPADLRRICGPGALACYLPAQGEIVVSGGDARPGEPPKELVIAHEYGHHVAANRSNRPWSALAMGTKRWSSHERICRGIARGRIHPRRYLENPGEAFAEAYAFLRFPGVIRWGWRIARPTQASFDAIVEDVVSPWARRTAESWSGEARRGQRRVSRRLHTPLDGRLKVTLEGPRRANLDLVLRSASGRRVLARARGRGSNETLRYLVCGRRAVRVDVIRVRGRGPFEISAARP